MLACTLGQGVASVASRAHHRWRRQQGRRAAASTFAHLRRRLHRGRRRAHLRRRRHRHRFMLHTCSIGYRITLYIRYSFGLRSPVSATASCQLGVAHKPIAHPSILAPPVAWHCLEPTVWTIPVLHGMLHPHAHPGLYSSSSLGVLGM